jgi:hypothetical protein
MPDGSRAHRAVGGELRAAAGMAFFAALADQQPTGTGR